ncbi:hypothetical protein HY637_05185 [Candidatus Woesearchaeota archaeon]|nr:hypothetical protein [Candidatus Woesearchaeota archaeon]
MASFKLCISDSSGRTFQKEIKDSMARPFIGLNIGESIKGDTFELSGYEFQITGGSDYCGFPMRRGILGQRKKISVYGGVGFRGAGKGIKRRKTVCGHKIHDGISQINLKVVKAGAKKLTEIFNVPEVKKEGKPEAKEAKPAAMEEPKPKEENAEAKESKTGPSEPKAAAKEDKKQHKEPKKEDNKE